jgi:hypothetical protein
MHGCEDGPPRCSMIRFACPHCGTGLKADNEKMGKLGHCPRCRATIEVPKSVGRWALLDYAQEAQLPAIENSVSTLDAEWEEVNRQKKTGFLLVSLAITGLACVALVGVFIVAKGNSPRPPQEASRRERAFQPAAEVEPPKTLPNVLVPRSPPPDVQSQRKEEQDLSMQPPAVAPPPRSNASLPMPSQEDESVDPPGKLLKELIPGYETRQIQGFTVLLSTQAIKEARKDKGRPFQAILTEFDGLVEVLPRNTLKLLRRLPIWIEWDSRTGDRLHALAAYGSADTYISGPYGAILKHGAIHLFSLKSLTQEKESSIQRTRLVLLHEMAHVIHHVMLGYDNRQVTFAYNQAMERRLYDNVLTDDGGRARAYAATNAREYFAELTCAYLDRCHYFPFTREDLKDHDPTGYRLMESVWGKGDKDPDTPTTPERGNGLKKIIDMYIRADIRNKSLRIEQWDAPVRATDGHKAGLLYRVTFSVAVANLRENNMERRTCCYYVFVVGNSIIKKQIKPNCWDAVTICKILDNP